ncbi:transcription factor TFIIH subunit p52/Tfb2 [Pelagophyceae sp. CCMP2097]|nr:transcription factor TFIIH subunit p52/Tfb2 [Pelagophyceae sp. CCMP2097]
MVWRWNTVLLYIVGEELDEKSEPASQVVGFLRDAKLMAPTTDDGASVEITGKGLEFLLKGRPEQLWELVEQYVRSDSADRDELVAFILTLAYCAVGDDYAVEALSQAQRRAITVLGSLGMVYQRTLASARFYPTQLGVDVAFGLRDGAAPAAAGPTARRQDDLQIIVQTNFQVLAYTDATAATSKLVMAMLLLFCTLRVRLPNLVVGDITRSAIKQCISRGIRVPQICRFLECVAAAAPPRLERTAAGPGRTRTRSRAARPRRSPKTSSTR